jgi:ubiquinol-cytochrome c reductase iron-sulfur subunit
MSDKSNDKSNDKSQALSFSAPTQVDLEKRNFLIAATACTGAIGAASVAIPFIGSMLPSERAKAAGAPVEVDISKIKPGEMLVAEWRGQPVWVMNRTDEMTANLVNLKAELADPESEVPNQPENCKNENRAIKANMAVIVGICTHLGCSPSAKLEAKGDMGENWTGGFFCPCHGSKFDLAGRVFKGSPAPTNLVIPPHQYLTETTLLIGEKVEA